MRYELALIRWARILLRASYDPDQPRVPAGSSDGGRWAGADGGGGSKPVRLAAGGPVMSDEPNIPGESDPLREPESLFRVIPDPRSRVQIDTENETWKDTARDAETAVNQVRRLEPDWQPTPSLYGDTVGAIAANRAMQSAAESRLRFQESVRMGHNGPPSSHDPASNSIDPGISLDSFRAMTGMPDLGGLPARAKSDGTVAKADIGGAVVFGVNSDAPGYTMFDRLSANAMRDQLIRNNPGLMSTTNIGWKPNDAVYHAEATSLMRWARKLGTSLEGKKIEIAIDRRLCRSCDQVLPRIGLELGDPEVTVIYPNGVHRTMRGGRWQE